MSITNNLNTGNTAINTANPTKTNKSSTLKTSLDAYTKTTTTPTKPTLKDAVNVQISPRAKEISLARSIIDETPDIREDKVAKYKELISKGEYKIDSGKIADGILKEAIKDELSTKPEIALED